MKKETKIIIGTFGAATAVALGVFHLIGKKYLKSPVDDEYFEDDEDFFEETDDNDEEDTEE